MTRGPQSETICAGPVSIRIFRSCVFESASGPGLAAGTSGVNMLEWNDGWSAGPSEKVTWCIVLLCSHARCSLFCLTSNLVGTNTEVQGRRVVAQTTPVYLSTLCGV